MSHSFLFVGQVFAINYGMGATFQQKALPAGRYRVGGEMRPYSRERLKQYADNTNKAIQSGLAVPFLDKHADVDADPGSALATKGWVKRFSVTDDGWLGYEVDVTDPTTKQAIENKSVRFTSPEFRDGFVDGKGLIHGDIIRHVATTPTPRNPDQGEIMALPTGVARFSLDDLEGDDDKKKKGDADDVDGDGIPDAADDDTEVEAKNPDLPPDPDEKSKMEAFVACMSGLGLELPAGFTFDSDGAIDILLTAAKTAQKAKAESDASKEQDDPPDVNDSQGMTQFSEEEIAKLSPVVQKRLKALQQQAVQFAEEKAQHNREKAIASVVAANLPPGLKTKLTERLKTVRFSDTGEVATLTIAEVAKLISDSLPPSVKFDEGDVTDIDPPDTGRDMTPAEAEVYARRIHSRGNATTKK